MIGLTVLFLLLPVLAIVAVLVGAWIEGRRSPWSFGIGRVISNTFAGIGGAPIAFVVVSFALNALPQQAVMMALGGGEMFDADTMGVRSGGLLAGWGLLWIFVWPLAQMVMTILALDALDGRVVGPRGSVVWALRRTPAAIVVTVLFTLGLFVGLAVLIVPGILLMLTWFVVLPVLAAEDAGILDSFGRSGELLKGMRWRLLLLLAMTGVVWLVVSALFGVLEVAMGGTGAWGPGVVQVIAATLLGTIPPAGTAAIYHEARTAKEGMGNHDLAAVFT